MLVDVEEVGAAGTDAAELDDAHIASWKVISFFDARILETA